ncbi:hypothetical protein BXZ70DRAFT_1061732 [Cristinia sonorae]|uniref:F-box domain-containing protein n=1 Tax=Cristinia sonorae TaxID=1940300 RepID=A0A8K0UVY8_9AGAR|nr:hypothetical protein BXZ70DRAFT_1061732 [Cristinia sonorae]
MTAQLPVEIWFLVCRFLVNKADMTDLQNVTLTSGFFREIAQPLLFHTVKLYIHAEYGEVGNIVRWSRSTRFHRDFLGRMAFVSSPRVAPCIRRIVISLSRFEHFPPRGTGSVDADLLTHALMRRVPSFVNLTRFKIQQCPIFGFVLRQLFATPSLIKLTIHGSPISFDTSLLTAPPAFNLKFLRLRSITAHQSFYLKPWLKSLFSSPINHIDLEEGDCATALASFIASDPSFPSLPSLQAVTIGPCHTDVLDISGLLQKCPMLKALSLNGNGRITDTVPIPEGCVPLLCTLFGLWSQIEVYLRHPSIRNIFVRAITPSQAIPFLERVHFLRPELTNIKLSYSLTKDMDTQVIKIALTRFRQLEEFTLNATPDNEAFFDDALDIFLTAIELDLAPTLRKILIGSSGWYRNQPERIEKIDSGLMVSVQMKCPALGHLCLRSSEMTREWVA